MDRILWFAPQGPTHHNYWVAQWRDPQIDCREHEFPRFTWHGSLTELDINGFERTSIHCFFTLVPRFIVVEHMMILFFSTYGTCLLLIFSNWEVMSGLVKGKELSSGQCPTTTTEWHTFHQISSSGDVRPCIFLSQLKIKKATRRDQWPIITNLLTWATKYNNNV